MCGSVRIVPFDLASTAEWKGVSLSRQECTLSEAVLQDRKRAFPGPEMGEPTGGEQLSCLHRSRPSGRMVGMSNMSPVAQRRNAFAVKRIVDLLVTLAAGPLVLILTGVIALVIRVMDGSPVIFAQERCGKDARPFRLYKFRTMRTGVDPFGSSPKDSQDARLTRFGRLLRATSLDELPQFLNVLKGEMTLVGPRPLYMAQAAEWDDRQRRRVLVKPGLTGLAQIRGRGSLTIEDKIELDVRYVEHQSFWLDARIILATVFRLFRPQDIYEERYSRDQETRSPGA